MIAVSNTSPLILLDKINCLWILGKLFEKVYIPQSVNKEWLRPGDYVTPECVVVSELSQESLSKAERLYQDLDRGEADAIALFSDTHRDILLLDDLKARKYAKSLGLSVAGTVGILITAKRKGMISELKPMLEDLKKHRYYLSENIYNEALILANET